MTNDPNPYESPQETGRRVPWVVDRLQLIGCGCLGFVVIFGCVMLWEVLLRPWLGLK